ncbi:MAG: Rpn family recombination-promoting nuclease/putative transposase [Roseburia sp.]|nr:Rpn family recombination-promoting nuclease/putative transposase [Roseburia sp.]
MQNNQFTSFLEAKGVIEYNMTNNYMFRYILQKNEKVLTGLICSLLHLKPEQIRTIEITNPIDLAGDITGKEFILDINIMLNDDTLINLEMQIANEHNWPERSLMYLCRSFDHLYRGQKYEDALPVYHIGFLDYTLFPEHPEFYATYQLLNVKNHHLYSRKFTLSVIDLTQTKLATEEDKVYEVDYWARIFKAKTWEELKMLAQNNEYLQEAADSIYKANSEEIVRQQCRAREDAERRERTLVRNYNLIKHDLAVANENLAVANEENTALKGDNAALKEDNAALWARIRELEAMAESTKK